MTTSIPFNPSISEKTVRKYPAYAFKDYYTYLSINGCWSVDIFTGWFTQRSEHEKLAAEAMLYRVEKEG